VIAVQLSNGWRPVTIDLAVTALGAVVLPYPVGGGHRDAPTRPSYPRVRVSGEMANRSPFRARIGRGLPPPEGPERRIAGARRQASRHPARLLATCVAKSIIHFAPHTERAPDLPTALQCPCFITASRCQLSGFPDASVDVRCGTCTVRYRTVTPGGSSRQWQ
jgi:hypothetical protein